MNLRLFDNLKWSPPPKSDRIPDWVARRQLENDRRRREAEDRILSAIDQLQLEGRKLTIRSIREMAGGGSFSTICRVLSDRQ
jgi:hypothetical protein